MPLARPGQKLRLAAEDLHFDDPRARFNALVGRIIEEAGFPALYLSGAAFWAGALALPDVGLFTLTELVEQATRLTRRVEIPVIVDADTGFGEPVNVERTVAELEAAGVAAIRFLEDQRLRQALRPLSGQIARRARRKYLSRYRAASGAKNAQLEPGDPGPHRRP